MKNTTLGYIEFNNSYLMLYRDIDKKDGSQGKWLGVGGKLEEKESADDCFIRETFEETGIRLEKKDLKRRAIIDFTSDNYASERMFLYTASVDNDYYNETCNEGQLKWINKSDILGLPLWEGDHVFLKKLLSEESFFVLTLQYSGKTGDKLNAVIENKLILSDIDSFDDNKVQKYTDLTENQLKHIYEPKEGLFLAETPVVINRAITEGYEPESFFCEHSQLFEASQYNYLNKPLYSCSKEKMSEITGYNLTHGMLSLMKRKGHLSIDELIRDSDIRKIAILEDVMNPTNVGAIVRSAAALGIEAMILTKGCADPLYRRAIRVSMGNIFSMPYAIAEDNTYIDSLKKCGYKIVSMALSDNAYNLDDDIIKNLSTQKTAIAFGTESTGITDELLSKSDYVVKIPMSKDVDSLNVAAASAVAFWALCHN